MKTLRIKLLTTAAALLLAASQSQAAISNFSFTGNFVNDNDVQLFTFTVGADSANVILRTYSYAGGVNAAGATIARGGFDPILAVFDSAGVRIGQNDDDLTSTVAADAGTGRAWDTYLNIGALAAGTYSATIMQYDNFNDAGTLAGGFRQDANPNFTPGLSGQGPGSFWDVSGVSPYNARDGHWAFDILNVEDAAVPEPSTYLAGALLALVFGVQGVRTFRSRKQTA